MSWSNYLINKEVWKYTQLLTAYPMFIGLPFGIFFNYFVIDPHKDYRVCVQTRPS